MRNLEAAFVLPNEDEWYKAAHYDVVSQSYLESPANGASPIACANPGATPNSANCGNAVGDTVNVGSYPSSASPNGTYDQGGNVWEWTKTLSGPDRRIRGGSFASPASELGASGSGAAADPQAADPDLGFRVVPEPAGFTQIVAGIGALIALHRRRRRRRD